MLSLAAHPITEAPQVPPEQSSEPGRTYTIAEVAALLRVTDKTIRRWLAAGRIHGVQPGGPRAAWRIPAAELERLLRGDIEPD